MDENSVSLCWEAIGEQNDALCAAYAENTTEGAEDGRVVITCKKGLWRVEAPTREGAEREARHYFIQYFQDGEYTKTAT